MSKNTTPVKGERWPTSLLSQFEPGDLLFGLQTDRRLPQERLQQQPGFGCYLTIDQIYKKIAAGEALEPERINTRNKNFLTTYSRALCKLAIKTTLEQRIRLACQNAILTVANHDFPLTIHFILDGLLQLTEITNSQYHGYTSAELRTAVREARQGNLDGKLVFWFAGIPVNFEKVYELIGGADSVSPAAQSPNEKQAIHSSAPLSPPHKVRKLSRRLFQPSSNNRETDLSAKMLF